VVIWWGGRPCDGRRKFGNGEKKPRVRIGAKMVTESVAGKLRLKRKGKGKGKRGKKKGKRGGKKENPSAGKAPRQ